MNILLKINQIHAIFESNPNLLDYIFILNETIKNVKIFFFSHLISKMKHYRYFCAFFLFEYLI